MRSKHASSKVSACSFAPLSPRSEKARTTFDFSATAVWILLISIYCMYKLVVAGGLSSFCCFACKLHACLEALPFRVKGERAAPSKAEGAEHQKYIAVSKYTFSSLQLPQKHTVII